jgi:YidC/Oxa1 family membrane protein insertase
VTSVNTRMFLWLGLAMLLWINYETWQLDYGTPPDVTISQNNSGSENAPNSSLGTTIPSANPTPAPADNRSDTAIPDTARSTLIPAAVTPAGTGTLTVITDVLDLQISLQGGDLVGAELLRYPQVKGQADRVRLLNSDAQGFYLIQTGLTDASGAPRPTHLANFTSDTSEYRLQDSANELRVPLRWVDPDRDLTVTKTYVFRRGEYTVEVLYDVDNRDSLPWQAAAYAQILRDDVPVERSMFNVESYAFQGPAYYDGTRYEKLDRDDADDRALSRDIQGGWVAGMQHHFVTAIVPSAEASYRYTLRTDANQYLLSVAGPAFTVAPQSGTRWTEVLFIGPKLQAQLETAGPRLDLVADYGMFTLLAKPLFWLLEQAHNWVNNWGGAIILITLLLKVLFYPLSEASGKSMAKMRVLGPRIKNLQDTYKDDREKLGRAMMELYKREKINPLAGCLPILLQMPVFLAFYWVLLESVEMRQAPFAFWIQDLSSRDPFFVLPVVMAGAMFVQYKLNPTPPDPIQAKVFMILPIVMSATFAFFPAGLVLYWVTNTLLTIAQQWNINRRIEAQAKKARSA